MLHQIYAKVIAGLESAAHNRVEKALDWQDDDGPKRGGA
ncbi:Integrase [Amycolatopsis camponoti]|uniref:Integrase n=1 Tax=Amycolatopsis camponoti TaxID=2606593 RepID=A0A6I8LVC6_9PSEU|nr:Integrase [Amycolatopsis camponoti]